MNKYHKWLLDEIESWHQERIINSEQAQQLSLRYRLGSQDNSWGKTILSAVGAIIFGLGVILFFAYNWQGMHRLSKLAIVLISLTLVHGTAWQISRNGNNARQKLSESLHLLGTMLFGAGIWLVAQIYHIDEHYPNGILVWSLAALALAWTIPSVGQALLALFLIALWSGFEIFDFHHLNQWGFWMVAFSILPLAWLKRSQILLFFGLVIFMLLYAFTITRINDDIIVIGLFAFACGQLLLARIAALSGFPASAGVLQTTANPVYLIILFITTFGDLRGELIARPQDWLSWFYWLLPLLTALAILAALLLYYRKTLEEPVEQAETGLILAALSILTLLAFDTMPLYQVSWLLLNLIFLGHGIIFILRGIQLLRWQQVALGGLLISTLITARFLDLFSSLLMRSLAFLIIGAGLFYLGHLYSKQKQGHRDA